MSGHGLPIAMLLLLGLLGCGPGTAPTDDDLADADADGSPASEDCDDADPARAPGRQEICGDEVDGDCDGVADDDEENCRTDRGGASGAVDHDDDGYLPGEDCNDNDEDAHPGAADPCDGVDSDCDGFDGRVGGETLEDCSDPEPVHGPFLYGPDRDGDGFTSAQEQLCLCAADLELQAEAPGSLAEGLGDDCDDDDLEVHPGAAEDCSADGVGQDRDCDGLLAGDEYSLDADLLLDCVVGYRPDADGDGLGSDAATSLCICDDGYIPAGVSSNGEDCDDGDAAVEGCQLWYEDADRDGYPADPDAEPDESGADAVGQSFCLCPDEEPASSDLGLISELELPTDWDCDDVSALVNPAAAEVCEDGEREDQMDNNCDGEDNGIDLAGCRPHYLDADRDGYGVAESGRDADEERCLCYAITGRSVDNFVEEDGDCDDSSRSISPGATEICNSKDDDCDSSVDEGVTTTYYEDSDGDGYGEPTASVDECSRPAGYVTNNRDCDDSSMDARPGAVEVCDTRDNDCDGTVDQSPSPTDPDTLKYYLDADGDGFGEASTVKYVCEDPEGKYVLDGTDCSDDDDTVFPGAAEICDGIDNDCDPDGKVDELLTLTTWYPDDDGDELGEYESARAIFSCYAAGEAPEDWEYAGYVINDDDCDDTTDDAELSAGTTYYKDGDNDGFWGCEGVTASCTLEDTTGDVSYFLDEYLTGCAEAPVGVTACEDPSGRGVKYVEEDAFGDCLPGNSSISPGKTENCTGVDVDFDCDGKRYLDDPDCTDDGGVDDSEVCDIPTGGP